MLMQQQRSQLVIIDVQERLAPHVEGAPAVVGNAVRLLRYAARLAVPATLTEHYPKGLGPTAAAVRAAAGNAAPVMEKITFSSWRQPEIRARIADLAGQGRSQVVVAGMEAHVCVLQTSLDLLAAGLSVFLVADAVGSRQAQARDLATARLRQAGAHIVSQEMVAFEWLERGDAPGFKDVVALVK